MGLLFRIWLLEGIIGIIMMKISVFLRQSQATSLPWGTIHWELWLKSQINANKSIPATGVAKNLDVPRGYCFKFHKGGYCSGCSFKHSCAKCDGPHRALNCNFRALEFTSVSYATVEDAIHTIRTVGPGCFMAKTDIKNAFRIIPVQPRDYNLLGICWRGFYYYDRCMPMGCSSSCKTFEIFSFAIEWIAQKKLHIDHSLHLLDDFLIISPLMICVNNSLIYF